MTVEVGSASGERHFTKEGINIMKREESFGIQEKCYKVYDAGGQIGGDRRVFSLFFIEVSECGVGSTKGATVFTYVRDVFRIFVSQDILNHWMKRKAGFGNVCGGGDNLLLVKAVGKGCNSGEGEAVGRGGFRISRMTEFEGFTFHVIGFNEAIVCVFEVCRVILMEGLFKSVVTFRGKEAAEVDVRGERVGVRTGSTKTLEEFPFVGNGVSKLGEVVSDSVEHLDRGRER